MTDRRVSGVSVVIPARNAEAFLARALDSLRAQTYGNWDAIIVDDGSQDGTAPVAESYSAMDKRIRLLKQDPGGVSRARNLGLCAAREDWVVFLDADDVLLPTHLERLAAALESDRDADAAVCHWAETGPDGAVHEPKVKLESDMFRQFTCGCAFAIHACMVRRSAVEAAGGFDPRLDVGEDWDLWQRIARAGTRFASVPEVLAWYYMRPQSGALDPCRMYEAAAHLIETGHQADPRVAHPDPKFAGGAPHEEASLAKWYAAFYCSGLAAGTRRAFALPQPDMPAGEELDPRTAGESLGEGIASALVAMPVEDERDWQVIGRHAETALEALSTRLGRSSFATLCAPHVAETMLRCLPVDRIRLCEVEAVRVEVTSLEDIIAPGATRVRAAIELEGSLLGCATLPVIDGRLSRLVLADEIASQFAWKILGRFFERTVYRDLRTVPGEGSAAVWRGDTCLGAIGPGADSTDLHDQIGWAVFLQELFGKPEWPGDRFYQPAAGDEARESLEATGIVLLEGSCEIPNLRTGTAGADAVLTLGGAVVTRLPVAPHTSLTSQECMVQLLEKAGFEICRVAVREALIGGPLEGLSLRERLRGLAASAPSIAGLTVPPGIRLSPAGEKMAHEMTRDGRSALLVGMPSRPGTQAAFRAAVPPGVAADAARAAGACLVQVGGGAEAAVALCCADVINTNPDLPEAVRPPAGLPSSADRAEHYDRRHFELLFSRAEDPWKYDNDYERVKYEQTLSMVPEGVERALELACAEGHFTCRLASRVRELEAADISQVALDRAAVRCAGIANVRFSRLDFHRDQLPAGLDLIVCSEALYYSIDEGHLREAGLKFANALRPGGWLLATHANQIVDGAGEPGFDWGLPFGAKRIGEILESTQQLQLVRELRSPLYRVQLFRAETQRKAATEVVPIPMADPLPPQIAALIRQPGDASVSGYPGAVTYRLPILMYHRVAPKCAPDLARYCVTPERFREQMQYLRDSGYHTVRLPAWRAAAESRRPLPGRAILLTFDDGYRDFAEHAMPVLESCGFSALVFVVTDRVGGVNTWDAAIESIPLLGWDEIRDLHGRGVDFGAHSGGHPSLLELPFSDVIREAARSRRAIHRELGFAPDAFAYPYGAHGGAVDRMVASCGYQYGLTTEPCPARFDQPMMALPRIEIEGADRLRDFVLKLGVED